jgi:hypothetical protein
MAAALIGRINNGHGDDMDINHSVVAERRGTAQRFYSTCMYKYNNKITL